MRAMLPTAAVLSASRSVLSLIAVSAILACAPVQASFAQLDKQALLGGTVTAGNEVYRVHVEDVTGLGVGEYTATTGPAHAAGPGLNILFGNGSPGTSFNTIRSYSTNTDYVATNFSRASANTVVVLDPFGSVVPLGTAGFRITYALPGPPVTPDALTIITDVEVLGTTFSDARIAVTTTVVNDGPDPVEVGIRYLMDYQIGLDDGPIFQQITPNGPALVNEAGFMPPAFQAYRIEDNDRSPSPPTYNVLGTATGPGTLVPSPTPPDLLQYVCWPDAFAQAFEYTTDPTRDIATTASDCSGATGGDVAVNYFFGSDQAHAIAIPPGGRHTVSVSLFGTPPPPPDDEAPACVVSAPPGGPAAFEVQDTGSGLAAVNVLEAVNAVITIPPFIIGSTDPIAVAAEKTDPSLDAEARIEVTDVAGNATVCEWVDVALLRTFTLLADKKIKIEKQVDSEGAIHANDKVEFKKGDPSTHTGDVTAGKEVKIDKDQTIAGDVTAEKVKVDRRAAVTGTITEAAVPDEPLPVPSYTAGGDKIKVDKGEMVMLPPGSYDDVKVEKGGTLHLTAGDYFFEKLDLKKESVLSADVAGGMVTVNVEDKIDFDKDTRVEVTGATTQPSRFLTFNSMKDVRMKKDALVQGNVVAPEGKVEMEKGVFFRGAVSAEEIDVKEATFVPHGSSASPPAVSPLVASAGEADAGPATLEAASEAATQFALSQNYPNPFNPATTIEFALPEARPVQLAVYDVLGRRVATLVDGVLPAGRHQVRWEAGTMATGMYFYRIVAGDFVKVRQMLLVK